MFKAKGSVNTESFVALNLIEVIITKINFGRIKNREAYGILSTVCEDFLQADIKFVGRTLL